MKRPIAALDMPDVVAGIPATPPPVIMTVRPDELLVEDDYQRGLSDASIRLIRRLVAEWDWRKFKAPTVAMLPEGGVVIDGQHTAIAAASHPGIDEIPVLAVEAAEQRQQAAAFVGINTTRLAITAAQLHYAQLAAGDEAALAIDRVCVSAGVKVLRLPPGRAVYKPGETIAVGAISGLVARQGEDVAAQALKILAAVAYGPVTGAHIRAVEHLLTDPEFVELDPAELPRIIAATGIPGSEKEARAFAATHCVPSWRGLAATWFKARKGKRKVAAEAAGEPRAETPRMAPVLAPQPTRRKKRHDGETATPDDGASEFAAAKRDTRLQRAGWEAGTFLKRCSGCSERFVGSLRASICADCAYAQEATP